MTEASFSPELIEKLLSEADKLGVKGASRIAETLRKQLTDLKRGDASKVRDNRTRAYYAVGAAWWHMRNVVTPEPAEMVGLDNAPSLFIDLYNYAIETLALTQDMEPLAALESQINSVRANLTRKGEGHFQLRGPLVNGMAKEWLDLFVYLTPEAALAKIAELTPKKD